ncbi:MAG TPA: FtsX-like permease family protein [Bacteroidia bacterium]|nr:FtsX-like permease family protein [Bacteroidia bacterium]
MSILKSPIVKISLRHLLAKKRQTIVAMMGVMFGIAIFIFQAGLMSGFQTTFIDQTVNTTANIRLYNEASKNRPSILSQLDSMKGKTIWVNNQKPKDEQPKIRNGKQIIEILEKDKRVIGVSPFLGSQAIFKMGIAQVSGRVSGVDIVKENILFNVQKNNIEGNILKLQTIPNGIILGEGLAALLGAKMGDNLNIISPIGVTLEMKVVGINRSGLTEVDKSRAYINLRNAQKLLQVDGSYITDINIKLKNINESETLAKYYEKKFGYKALDWKEANANIFGIFKIQNMITYLIIVSILIVSGFGIFNILMMIIYEKMPDIAILKAVGYKDKDIVRIFLTESLLIGIVGGLLGLALGFVMQQVVGSIRMDVKGFVSLEYLKFNSSPAFYAFAYFFALIVTAAAGYIPARKASKIDAIEIIRSK